MVLSIQHSPNSHKQEISNPTNQLLNSLPESELSNLRVHSERIIIPAKKSLYKLNEPIDRVYFPLRGKITIDNYVALRMVACRCDRIILEEYTRLFS